MQGLTEYGLRTWFGVRALVALLWKGKFRPSLGAGLDYDGKVDEPFFDAAVRPLDLQFGEKIAVMTPLCEEHRDASLSAEETVNRTREGEGGTCPEIRLKHSVRDSGYAGEYLGFSRELRDVCRKLAFYEQAMHCCKKKELDNFFNGRQCLVRQAPQAGRRSISFARVPKTLVTGERTLSRQAERMPVRRARIITFGIVLGTFHRSASAYFLTASFSTA
jgi:hypothetical protein